MILVFVAVLFILAVTFFIGSRVGKSVPDEIIGAKKYLLLAQDLVLFLAIGLVLLGLGLPYVALAVIVLMVCIRAFFPRYIMHAPLSGIVLGAVVLLPIDYQVIVILLVMVMNFIVGSMTKELWRKAIIQPLGALLVYGLTQIPF